MVAVISLCVLLTMRCGIYGLVAWELAQASDFQVSGAGWSALFKLSLQQLWPHDVHLAFYALPQEHGRQSSVEVCRVPVPA